ncbi:MAG TPA: hypothetical protein VIV12_08710 [Streptosporangiaceae bacterium]
MLDTAVLVVGALYVGYPAFVCWWSRSSSELQAGIVIAWSWLGYTPPWHPPMTVPGYAEAGS